MPTLKRLAELQNHLRKLGSEQEIAGTWGEQPYIADLPPPAAIDEGKPSALDAGRYGEAALQVEQSVSAGTPTEAEPSLEALLDASPADNEYASFLKNIDIDALNTPAEIADVADDDLANLLEPDSNAFSEEGPGLDAEQDLQNIQSDMPGQEPSLSDTMLNAPDNFLQTDTETEQQYPEYELNNEAVGIPEIEGSGETPSESSIPTDFSDIANFDANLGLGMPESEGVPDAASANFGIDQFSADEITSDFEEPVTGFEESLPTIEESENFPPEEVSQASDISVDKTFSGEASSIGDISSLPSMDEIHDIESFDFNNELPLAGEIAGTVETAESGTPAAESMEAIEVPDIGTEAFHAPDELDQELASLEKGALEPENFSIDSNWEDNFTIPGFEPKKPEKPAVPEFAPIPERPIHEENKAVDIELTDAQVDELQETLLSYPLNVRLCVEDIIANNHGTVTHQKELIQMLVDGASAYDAAKLAGKILRRPIEVPRGYDKRRGAAFEEERNSFRYIFIHSILPVLQIIVLAAIGLGILGFIGYNFIYRPVHAQVLYTRGYNLISKDKFPESVELFIKATNEWRMKPWFYKYAEKYIEKRQYGLAEQIYWTLLSDEYWPRDIKGTLDYARMKADIQYDFAHAEQEVMNRIIKWRYFHKEALLFLVRNYFNWANYLEQQYKPPQSAEISVLYEKARLQLATLMEKYGKIDQYLELMLIYLIRSEKYTEKDNVKEVAPYAKYYLGNKKSKFSSLTLAELADYLMDHEIDENVQEVLLKAVKNEPYVPEAHSAIARWFKRSMLNDKELNALENSVFAFEKQDKEKGLDNKQIRRYLADLIRLSELYINDKREERVLDAMVSLERCIKRYEQSLEELRFPASAEFGKAYALLGDIYYYKPKNFNIALSLYAKAESNGYVTPDMDYHRGYIYYKKETLDDYRMALSYFYRASLSVKPTPYLLMALGNTLYKRGDFFAAQSYYKALVDMLQTELDLIPNPSPQQKPSHEEIVRLLVAARNNLGAAYLRVANLMGDSSKRADAMAQFTESARIFDSLTRDQKTMIRSDAKNYGFLNLDFVLHPKRAIDIILDTPIKADMHFPQ